MKKTESFHSYAFKSGGFNLFFKDGSKKSEENSLNFYDRALINARDEVIQRKQEHSSSQATSDKSSLKESEFYYRNTSSFFSLAPVDDSENYIQIQQQQEPATDKNKAGRKNLKICSKIMNRRQYQVEPAPRYRFLGVSDCRGSFVKNGGEVYSIETSEEYSVNESLQGTNKKSPMVDGSPVSKQMAETESSDNCPEDAMVPSSGGSGTGSFYLSEFLSVKL